MLERFRSSLMAASEATIHADPTLGGALLLHQDGAIEIAYAPFDPVNTRAKIVLVGVTPGRSQASTALVEARRWLFEGVSAGEAMWQAKQTASFGGPLRANLVAMLDHIGLARWLDLTSTKALFEDRGDLVHFTSAIRYPVFVAGSNYSGSPGPTRNRLLKEMVDCYLAEEARQLSEACWVPLGGAASEALDHLVARGQLRPERVLSGLPHPSGANAERIAYFLGKKAAGALSSRTNPQSIDDAKARLLERVAELPR